MSRTRARSVSLGSGLALAVVAATLSTASLAAASAPSPVGLAQTSPDSTTTILSWDRELSAARYTVQVDNDASFSSPEFSQVTSNVTAVPHTPLKSGLNHWRVQSISASNVKSEWTTAMFERANPLVPQLLSPTEGAELAQPDEPPLLQWGEVPGAKSYSVEIDDSVDFIGSKKWTTNTTSLIPSTPLALGTWFWRVTATDASGQVSQAADPSSFSVRALPAPQLVSPINEKEVIEDVVLDWAPVRGAKTYQLQVATNNGFEAGDLLVDVTGIQGTRFSPANGLDNDDYYWRVRAFDSAGSASAWAASPFEFLRAWPDRPWPVAPVQPGFPEYPADFDTTDPDHESHDFYADYKKNHDPDELEIATSTDRSPFIQWTPVQHASHYELQLSTSKNFEPIHTSTCTVAGTTFTPTNASYPTGKLDQPCGVKEETLYFWRVRAMDRPIPVEGIYSPTQKFSWQPSWYSSVTPADHATVEVPTFTWKSRVAADEFKISIHNRLGLEVASGTTHANSWTSPVRLEPTEGPFRWSLTAFTADGTSSLIRGRTFNLSTPTAPVPGTPALRALTGIESDAPSMRAPRLAWTPHPDAASYRVSFGHADVDSYLVPTRDESFGKELFYPTLTDTGTRIMRPGRYKWWVDAFAEDGSRIASSGVNIVRIAGFDEVTGQRIALDGAALAAGRGCDSPLDLANETSPCPEVPTTPVLTWDPQDGIAFYAVYVSYDKNFTNLTEPTKIPASTGTMYAYDMLTLPDNTSGVPYYWHIRPCKTEGICGPDPISAATGLAKHAFKKVSPQVETVATPEVVSTNEVTFSWRDYHETNQTHRVTRDGAPSWSAIYHRAPAVGGAINASDLSNQSAARYRIRVATDPTFAKIIDNQLVDQATYTSLGKLYPEGPLYWKVSAVDVNGNELSSSTERTFIKSSSPVVQTTPAPNASLPGSVQFRWAAEAFTGEYEIEVSRNDRLFSSVNRLFSTKVWTTAYAWSKRIPVSNDPYYWRVRRIDSSGNLTAWSEGTPFRVVSESVSLTSPSTGSTQTPNGPTLTWSAIPGAATYAVEVKDASGKVVESRITPATAYAPFVTLASGIHTWSVTARDNDGKALAPSTSSNFVVDASLEALTDPVIGSDTEKPGVDSVLTVAPLSWNRPGVVETHQWLRDGKTLRGATESEYTVTLADFNKTLTVRVTGTLPGYASESSTSAEMLIGPGGVVVASTPPQVSGTAKVGQRLTASAGTWPSRTKVSYQWLRNGSPIPGATSSRYTLGLADAVTRISVRATGSLTGMRDGTSTSSTRAVPKATSTVTMKLSSTKVKRGTKVTLTGTVAVPSVSGPTGKVVVKRGNKKLKTITLTVGKNGRISFVLPKKKFKKGRHKLRLIYQGTNKIAGSKSKRLVLRIT